MTYEHEKPKEPKIERFPDNPPHKGVPWLFGPENRPPHAPGLVHYYRPTDNLDGPSVCGFTVARNTKGDTGCADVKQVTCHTCLLSLMEDVPPPPPPATFVTNPKQPSTFQQLLLGETLAQCPQSYCKQRINHDGPHDKLAV